MSGSKYSNCAAADPQSADSYWPDAPWLCLVFSPEQPRMAGFATRPNWMITRTETAVTGGPAIASMPYTTGGANVEPENSILRFAFAVCAAAPALAADLMPAARQNAVIAKYWAVCHNDAARNGGLPLQHFDASEASASLNAILLSKITSGAMGAAGIPIPDQAAISELVHALAAEAAGATEWAAERNNGTLTRKRSSRSVSPRREGGGVPVHRIVQSGYTGRFPAARLVAHGAKRYSRPRWTERARRIFR